jgi:1-acyl-sn-glycerol-3-phosphate acyltransferase
MSKEGLVGAIAETLRAGDLPEPTAEPQAAGVTRRRFDALVEPERPCDAHIDDTRSCGLPAVRGHHRCALHGGVDISDASVPALGRLGFDTWPALIRHLLLASYDIDPLGLDPVVSEMVWHVANYLYYDYFRVEVSGIEHVPESGPAVLAANHGGAALPYDGLILPLSVANEAPIPRRVRVVATEIFNMLPFLSHLYRKAGAAFAAPEDATWVLEHGHLLGVFPEGVRGFQKPLSEAYRLRRFGKGGFVRIAMTAGAPIVPVAIVGSEEVHPALYTSKGLARVVRLLFPEQRVEEMAIWVNPIPLPVRWHVRFLPPVDLGRPTASPDRLAVLETTQHVRDTIQAELDRMIADRGPVFW